jgi:hypothetical protein
MIISVPKAHEIPTDMARKTRTPASDDHESVCFMYHLPIDLF